MGPPGLTVVADMIGPPGLILVALTTGPPGLPAGWVTMGPPGSAEAEVEAASTKETTGAYPAGQPVAADVVIKEAVAVVTGDVTMAEESKGGIPVVATAASVDAVAISKLDRTTEEREDAATVVETTGVATAADGAREEATTVVLSGVTTALPVKLMVQYSIVVQTQQASEINWRLDLPRRRQIGNQGTSRDGINGKDTEGVSRTELPSLKTDE